MNDHSLDDVVMAAQVGPSHAAGFVHTRKASFGSLSVLAQQPLAALASDPPAVLLNRPGQAALYEHLLPRKIHAAHRLALGKACSR
jgi:hypothetical protein